MTVGVSGTWLHSDSSLPSKRCRNCGIKMVGYERSKSRTSRFTNIETTVLEFTKRQFTPRKVLKLKKAIEVYKRTFRTVATGCEIERSVDTWGCGSFGRRNRLFYLMLCYSHCACSYGQHVHCVMHYL
jgi:hypothetical protein